MKTANLIRWGVLAELASGALWIAGASSTWPTRKILPVLWATTWRPRLIWLALGYALLSHIPTSEGERGHGDDRDTAQQELERPYA